MAFSTVLSSLEIFYSRIRSLNGDGSRTMERKDGGNHPGEGRIGRVCLDVGSEREMCQKLNFLTCAIMSSYQKSQASILAF